MPTVTKNLIIINVLAFFGTIVAQRYKIDLNWYLGLHLFSSPDFNAAQLITYMFMHSGFTHIFFNMFAVFMFAPILEQTWGSRRFLLFYIACGIGAALIQEGVQYIHISTLEGQLSQATLQEVYTHGRDLLLNGMTYGDASGGPNAIGALNVALYGETVGASGAVYAILLAFGMLYPNNRLFVFPLPVPIKAKYFVIGYAAIELWAGISNAPGDNVAHFAHLGGMLFGLFFILYWKKKDKSNGTYYS
ncbi:MAG: rhomboid family intramembrane serine protease [Mediterranea sp.]|jgi:membrane associated rhomboid family serine protease|nr:rhomboid family intramembrane serine protease [Mediterranea sp.]